MAEHSHKHNAMRRGLAMGGGLAAGLAMVNAAAAANAAPVAEIQTQDTPRELDGNPVPEPPPEKSG